LERSVDVTDLADLHLLARYVTPAEIRRAGRGRMTDHLLHAGVRRPTPKRWSARRSPRRTVSG
jgi:hypothetical protein